MIVLMVVFSLIVVACALIVTLNPPIVEIEWIALIPPKHLSIGTGARQEVVEIIAVHRDGVRLLVEPLRYAQSAAASTSVSTITLSGAVL